MKIIFDHQIFAWQKYGGISRYACQLAQSLANDGVQEVTILSPLYVNHYLEKMPSKLKVLGVPVAEFSRSGRVYRILNRLLAWPFMHVFQPDIVHETYYSSAGIAPRKSTVIVTVHDMIHEKFSDCFSSVDPTTHEKRLAVTRADHVICVSENTRKDLIDIFNINPNKVSVVHHGFSLTESYEKSAELRNIRHSGRPFLLYVGSRFAYKNFERLLYAYADSKFLKGEYDLLCFGGGDFSSEEKLLFERLNIPLNTVRYMSGDDRLLAKNYQAASAFIYPSLYEGFGIPPLEAMSYNCPVICSNVSSIPEVVGDAGEMFDPFDVLAMRQAIERVMKDEQLRKSLISRGQERIKFFSWERCAEETLSVYIKAISMKNVSL